MKNVGNKYQNGKIYSVYSPNTEIIYIGSTTHIKLIARLFQHVKHYRAFLINRHSYLASFDILDYGEYGITLLEEYPCNSKEELRKREDEYIKMYGDKCVNRNSAYNPNNKYHTYADGKIYKVFSKQTNDIYVGSTIQELKKRFGEHKKVYNDFINNKSYAKSSVELMKYDDVEIELIELYPCKSELELRIREQYYIDTLKTSYNVINKINAVADKDAKKKWRLAHLKEETARLKAYYNDPKNKVRIQEIAHKSYLKQKPIYQAKAKIQATCACGDILSQVKMSRHITTQRHIKRMVYVNAGQPVPKSFGTSRNMVIECECGNNYTFGHRTRHLTSIMHLNKIAEMKKLEEDKKKAEEGYKEEIIIEEKPVVNTESKKIKIRIKKSDIITN